MGKERSDFNIWLDNTVADAEEAAREGSEDKVNGLLIRLLRPDLSIDQRDLLAESMARSSSPELRRYLAQFAIGVAESDPTLSTRIFQLQAGDNSEEVQALRAVAAAARHITTDIQPATTF